MLRRYILIQIPAWLVTLVVMLLLREWLGFSAWIVSAVLAVLLIKDMLLYPVVKHAYDPASIPSHARLLGKTVVAESELNGPGYVRLDGELWRAALADDSGPLPPGRRGRVVARRGLTLLVEPESTPAD